MSYELPIPKGRCNTRRVNFGGFRARVYLVQSRQPGDRVDYEIGSSEGHVLVVFQDDQTVLINTAENLSKHTPAKPLVSLNATPIIILTIGNSVKVNTDRLLPGSEINKK